MDIGVYFRPEGGVLEWDNPEACYSEENEIWLDLERMLGREVDLLALNRAAPVVAESILRVFPS